MKKIENLVLKIDAEMEDAEKYAEEAYICRREDKEFADMLAKLAREELEHAERLHQYAVSCINAIITSEGVPPAHMKTKWDNAHEIYIKWKKSIVETLDAV